MGSTVHGQTARSNTASAVAALEDAGAITVAKTNCQECSYGILGDESAFGRTFNLRDYDRNTVGSSLAALVGAEFRQDRFLSDSLGIIRGFEATQIHHDQRRDRADDYQPGVRAELRRGVHIGESDHLSAVAELVDLRRRSDRLRGYIDGVITPSFAGPELKSDTLDPIEAAERSVRFSQRVMGCPAISVPLDSGPLNSVQFFSRPGTDLNLLSLVERILRHHWL